MARIFQKYVTPEGRSIIPPEGEELLKQLVEEKEYSAPNIGGGAITMGSLMKDEGKKITEDEDEEEDMKSATPAMAVMVGIRSITQLLNGMMKMAGPNAL